MMDKHELDKLYEQLDTQDLFVLADAYDYALYDGLDAGPTRNRMQDKLDVILSILQGRRDA